MDQEQRTSFQQTWSREDLLELGLSEGTHEVILGGGTNLQPSALQQGGLGQGASFLQWSVYHPVGHQLTISCWLLSFQSHAIHLCAYADPHDCGFIMLEIWSGPSPILSSKLSLETANILVRVALNPYQLNLQFVLLVISSVKIHEPRVFFPLSFINSIL